MFWALLASLQQRRSIYYSKLELKMWRLITFHLYKSYRLAVRIKAFSTRHTLPTYHVNLYVLLLAFLDH